MRRPAVIAVAALLCLLLAAPASQASDQPQRQTNVTLPRMPSISPDGQTVVFAWRGDLWSVPAAGGDATRLTSHPADESWTRFSPDGTRIAFNSERRGNNGLYTMNADGTGVVEVLAFDRAVLLCDWADNGQEELLLFSAFLEADAYRSPRPYQLPAEGGVYQRIHDAFGRWQALEPGGSRVLFERGGAGWDRRHYRGPDARDLWLYDPDGEDQFIQLTTWEGNDGLPRWAGEDRLVFASDREDRTINLYLMELADGEQAEEKARRLTNFDDRDIHEFDVTPDGSRLVFSRWDTLYVLDLDQEGAQPQPISIRAAEDERDSLEYINVSDRVSDAALSPDGKTMAFIAYGQLYVRGVDDNSATRRVSTSLAKHKDIAWSPDGGTLFFVSDESGRDAIFAVTATRTRSEIVSKVEKYHETRERQANGEASDESENGQNQPANGEDDAPATKPAEETRQRGRAERSTAPDPAKWPDAISFNVELVSESDQGDHSPVPAYDAKHLAFTRGVGEIWVLNLESGDEHRIYNGWSGGNYIWSYDNKHLIYTTDDADFNTDVWITRSDGTGWRGEGAPVNISRHPQGDTNMSISHDGRVLTFASQRGGGSYDIYRVYFDEELEALAPVELEAYYKSLAERVKKARVPGVPNWAKQRGTVSPKARALATRPTGEEASRAAVDTATRDQGRDRPATRPATRAATQPATQPQQETPRFSINQLRRALRDFILEEPQDEPAAGEAPQPDREAVAERPQPTLDDFDLDEAYLRLQRIATGSSRPMLLPDASAVYYSTSAGTFRNPWNGSASRVGDSVNMRGMTPKGEKIFYTSGNRGGYFDTSGPRAHQQRALAPADRLEVDLAEMNERKFLDMARTLGARFYHPTMKDLDWGALTREYLPLARAARTADEFQTVAMRLLGELNASHLGVSPPGDGRSGMRQSFGQLGIRVEPAENGFVVRSVMETGPAGRGPMRLQEGDVITHIELEEVDTNRPLDLHLADMVGREIVVTVQRDEESLDLLLRPVSSGAISGLAYDAWRNENLRKVREMSDNRLGYIHIRGMDQPSLDVFVRDLHAAADGKEGLIIDVRNNGGGWTADRLLASIMYPRHAYTIPRGLQDSEEAHRATAETGGYPNDRLFIPRYDLPMNMLCNEKSFSNAEIVSHAFKTLGRGTLVGEQTAGGVISTGSFTLLDGTRVRLPFRGWYLPDGTDMENNGAMPDIRVPQTPEAEAAETDEQLEVAVRDLLERLPAREGQAAAD